MDCCPKKKKGLDSPTSYWKRWCGNSDTKERTIELRAGPPRRKLWESLFHMSRRLTLQSLGRGEESGGVSPGRG